MGYYADRLFVECYYAMNAKRRQEVYARMECEEAAEAARKAEETRYYSGEAEEDELRVYKFAQMNGLVDQSFTDSYHLVREFKVEAGRVMANAEYVAESWCLEPVGKYYLAKVPIRIILFTKDSSKQQTGDVFPEKYANLPLLILRNNLLYMYDGRGFSGGTSNMIIPALIVRPSRW